MSYIVNIYNLFVLCVFLLLAYFSFIHPASYVSANIRYDSKRMALLEKPLELAWGDVTLFLHIHAYIGLSTL